MGELLAAAVAGGDMASAAASYAQRKAQEPTPVAEGAGVQAQMPDYGMAGMNMAAPPQPQGMDIAAPDMSYSQQPPDPGTPPDVQEPQDMQPPVDNSMAGNIQQVLGSIGTPDQPQPPQTPSTPIRDGADAAQNEITITGDDWKPHKETVLAQIADFLMQRRGMNPLFKETNDRHNMESAMQGFQKDPVTAIDRVRKIDPATAWKMYDQYATLHKDDEVTQQRLAWYKGNMASKGLGIASGMMGAVTDEDTYQKVLPAVRSTLQNYGLSGAESLLGDHYDPDKVRAFIRSSVEAKDQLAQAITASHYSAEEANQSRRTDIYAGRTAVENRNSTNEITNRDARTTEEIRHNKAMEPIAQERADKAKDNNKAKAGNVGLLDDKGNQVGVLSADGTKATVTAPGGAKYVFSVTKDAKGRIRLGNLLSGGNATKKDGVVTATPD